MILASLAFLETEMNGYFQRVYNNNEVHVMLSAIINPDGSLLLNIEKKIIITLLNIEDDIHKKNALPPNRG